MVLKLEVIGLYPCIFLGFCIKDMKITVINGTNRKGNRSMEVSRDVVKIGEEMGYEVGLVTLENWTELFRGDYVKLGDVKEGKKEDIEKMVEADVLIFVVPTYHTGIPSSLKNFFDSLSSKRAYDKKIIGLISSNSSNKDLGARQARQVINGIIAYKKVQSFIVPQISIINFDEIDPHRIEKFIEYCVGFV
jgi:NAD(P)H-dependent FMN reductase